ncbi:MAG: DNA polymerase III subunit gamma/tau [Candidatus Magasanikbacteria bacterium]|nr:DNA polymerase III subunit gamma/tau [Candidatus Magasanikbacteria bacterium]MCA9389632.1 DNA polymerase III subunit gamma/tau [Candidatus Magasanikbacteria bacterium]MCA9391361.1 DNA polymerase III subunit gamma/tau [Candidatus Magasanikbacteria bacterium]USN52169.1 MAG: DNA polymerase III subunit gamma/tau [Candidatus Nomurabacteria bacterium]HPF94991.1 DNA polymerase III subunit gamma/tau [bacterium]
MPSLSQIYRPQRFADVTGQQHITETLRKELATGRLGHVFLFSGPRGVGKTTTARILAKALNCKNLTEGEPCTVCESCKNTQDNRSFDAIELDAATNNGVDAVREAIIEHVRFAPASGHRKVYILDEAHMLSTAAWNALLKTLEEPPEYAFFILATTEWHKVPATILSRSQQFAFRRIDDENMRARLLDLAKAENWTIDDGAIRILLKKADGCVRDAETLLGQVGGLGDSHITEATVGLVIPVGQQEKAAELMVAWGKRHFGDSWNLVERFADEGVPFTPLFDDLIQCVEDLLAADALPTKAEQFRSGSAAEKLLMECLQCFTPSELHNIALSLFERRRDVKMGMDPVFAVQLVGLSLLSPTTNTTPQNTKTPEAPTKTAPIPKVMKDKPQEEVKPISTEEKVIEVVEQSAEPIETISEPIQQEEKKSVQTESEAPAVSLAMVRSQWLEIIRVVDEKNHSLPFILKTASPYAVEGLNVIIKFQYPFHMDRLIGDGKNRGIIQEAARAVLKNDQLMIEGIVAADVAAAQGGAPDMVGNILQAFGGSVVES